MQRIDQQWKGYSLHYVFEVQENLHEAQDLESNVWLHLHAEDFLDNSDRLTNDWYISESTYVKIRIRPQDGISINK